MDTDALTVPPVDTLQPTASPQPRADCNGDPQNATQPTGTATTTDAADCLLTDVVVIIPALNEERSLPLVMADIPNVKRVIVVDNGSSDSTAAVARNGGALVVCEPKRGYGSACLRGLATIGDMITAGDRSPRIVVFLDADYSDHPDLLPKLVEPILQGQADLVLGSRLMGQRERGAMPPQSVYGNRFACFLMRWLFGVGYTDLGPFRAIRYRSLQSLNMTDDNFGWTIEMQIKAAQRGLRITEIAVPYRRRVGVSKISGTLRGTVMAGTKILLTIAKYAWRTSNRYLAIDHQSR